MHHHQHIVTDLAILLYHHASALHPGVLLRNALQCNDQSSNATTCAMMPYVSLNLHDWFVSIIHACIPMSLHSRQHTLARKAAATDTPNT